ncbi:hypothetical protein ACCX84_12245 [Pantoea trifolii]|uniref:hypothetical protein n=1 Tax=Pantoea trifolii TaxID=2968030 RepID=UPI003ED85F8D
MDETSIFSKIICGAFFLPYILMLLYILSASIGEINYLIFFLPVVVPLLLSLLFWKKLSKLKNLNDFLLFSVAGLSAINLVAYRFNHTNEFINKMLDMVKNNDTVIILLAISATMKAFLALFEFFQKKK